MKKILATTLTAILCALGVATVTMHSVGSQERTDKLHRSDRKIPDHYIVVLNDEIANNLTSETAASELTKNYGGKVDKIYQTAIKGYSAEMSEKEAIALSKDPRVKFVEEDGTVYANTTQSGATWGLDRIDQRDLPLNGTYTYTPTGSGVNAYIIDTGIRVTHNEFGGRAVVGYDAVGDGQNGIDCNGHGTHVSGTVGGSTYGVAKGVTLYAVRVLGCDGSGTNSGVIAGVDWVANNHVSPAVANMSLGGGASTALDNSVANAIASGVTFAIAAGNSNTDACTTSPARVPSAITVGATTNTDARASFSNYGSCVDIFAPGNNITSSWNTSDTATNTISGTSMATPHVAGVAALYLQGNPSASPATVTSAITGTASSGKLTSIGSGSPNLLLYSLLTTGGGGGGGGGGTCGGGSFTGSLSGSGVSQYQPNNSYYYSASSGAHSSTLSGPAGADFDLYLQKWNGSAWSSVASSLGSTANESINYNGTAGYYRWRVYSYSGSGSYTLCTNHPS